MLIYTPDQILHRGLRLVGMEDNNMQKQSRKSNIEDFKAFYGCHPVVLAQIWEDLQTSHVIEARIDVTKKRSIHMKNFLRACMFLNLYPTESVRKVQSGNTKKTVRKWCWYFLERLQHLKKAKVRTLTAVSCLIQACITFRPTFALLLVSYHHFSLSEDCLARSLGHKLHP